MADIYHQPLIVGDQHSVFLKIFCAYFSNLHNQGEDPAKETCVPKIHKTAFNDFSLLFPPLSS
ncbi:hypothetical protein K737_300012 [Holospora undulata HU1]|uniref:Uncharacterized protein n=1 Tax=Holospora undulata HU1 TaxID=1321371 RepID=A0A061JH81_9PROT|nr:hypothetical protein K737_300012 [Holospora undulata HU1]